MHEDLEEEVYMEILPRFESHGGKNKVCRLKKKKTFMASNNLPERIDNMIIANDEIEWLTLKESLTVGKIEVFSLNKAAYSRKGIFISQLRIQENWDARP
ncbi:hypothetical protein CR513_62780, partial [Mucuna pruriens]